MFDTWSLNALCVHNPMRKLIKSDIIIKCVPFGLSFLMRIVIMFCFVVVAIEPN